MAGQKTLTVTVAIFLLAITTLGLVFLSILSQWSSVDTRMAWVKHTQRVLQAVDHLEGNLRDMGMAGRDYLIEPKDAHRLRFQLSKADYHATHARLLELTRDNPSQQRHIRRSHAHIQNKLFIWDALLEQRRRQAVADPTWMASAMKIMTISDLLTHIFSIRTLEYRLLTQRVDSWALKIEQDRTIVTTAFSLCLLVLLGTFAFLLLQIRRRLDAETQLRAVNLELEDRIVERTRELADINEQLRTEIAAHKNTQSEIIELNQQLEQRVTERTRQLESINKELESFSYSVSHDLRTPLRAVVGFARMLGDRLDARLENEDRRLLKIIGDNAGKMSALIDDLLAFSKLGRAALNQQFVDMNGVVNEALHELVPAHDGALPEIRLDPLPPAAADRNLIRQVWVNLIGNALKFSGARPQALIEISGATEDGVSHYWVKDNGAGFDMRFYDKLFGVFQRLHGVDEFPGTGVGLAIVQRIVSRHGGKVWAEGEIDRGAVFHFTLPGR